MPIWQLCANLLIPNCLRSNLSYSPLATLELYVNCYNSQDSRYWGPLPEEYIVGKATLIWKSKNGVTDEIRMDRIFKKIK